MAIVCVRDLYFSIRHAISEVGKQIHAQLLLPSSNRDQTLERFNVDVEQRKRLKRFVTGKAISSCRWFRWIECPQGGRLDSMVDRRRIKQEVVPVLLS